MSKKQLNIDTEEGTIAEENVADAPAKATRAGILAAISAAMSSGNLTSGQARQMRASLGFTQADFTRKQPTDAQRKARRKMQKESRRRNRGNGKGQKKSGRV